MNKKDWLPRQKIAIIGGTGKLGKSLIKRLVDLGADKIIVISRNARENGKNPFFSDAVAINYVSCDILDLDVLVKAVEGCTVVFHLAAIKYAAVSRVSPIEYSRINALGTAHVMEACRRCGAEKVVYVSTTHVYGKMRNIPVTETHRTKPLSLYAASKLAGEVFVEGYSVQYGIKAAVARMSNLYGPHFGEDTVLGKAVQQIAAGRPVKLHDLRPIRDFIYIDDAADALLCLAAHEFEENCLTVNVSTGRGVSISEAVSCLFDIAVKMGLPEPEIIEPKTPGGLDLPVLVFSNELFCRITGWRPQKTLIEGLTASLRSKVETMS